jgi:uncharacterized membrane protein YtjA (UPF0391 family)
MRACGGVPPPGSACRNRPTPVSDRADGAGRARRLKWRRDPGLHRPAPFKENIMLHYAVVFFVIALIAAVLGFSGIAAGAAGIAKVLFVVFLVMAIASFVINLVKGR